LARPRLLHTLVCSHNNSSQSYASSAYFSPAILTITPFNSQRLVFSFATCFLVWSCVFHERNFLHIDYHCITTLLRLSKRCFSLLSNNTLAAIFPCKSSFGVNRSGRLIGIPKIGAFLGQHWVEFFSPAVHSAHRAWIICTIARQAGDGVLRRVHERKTHFHSLGGHQIKR